MRKTNASGKHIHVIPYPLISHFYIVKLGYAGVNLFFLIFAPKHRLWVLVRTASTENFQFLQLKKKMYITWVCFRNGKGIH